MVAGVNVATLISVIASLGLLVVLNPKYVYAHSLCLEYLNLASFARFLSQI